MPTSASPGFQGQVYISIDGGSNYIPVGEAKSVSIAGSQEQLDATSFDSVGWKESIVGLKGWELTIDGFYINQSYRGNIGQVNVQDSFLGGQVVRWKILPLRGTGNIGYVGDGFVTTFDIAISVDSAVELSIGVMGTAYLDTYQAS